MKKDEMFQADVFKGQKELWQQGYTLEPGDIEYLTSLNPDYRGNPLIESLPSEMLDLSISERTLKIIETLSYKPIITEEHLNLSEFQRLVMTQNVRSFTEVTSQHIELDQRVWSMLIQGYKGRSPFKRKLSKYEMPPTETELIAMYIIGGGGAGKTSSMKRIVQAIPQVIKHAVVPPDQRFTKAQVVWMGVSCPRDGSVRSLCKRIIQTFDAIFKGDANYVREYIRKDAPVEDLQSAVMALAKTHFLGVLIVDEIQYSLNNKKKRQEIVEFLTELSNDSGTPLIVIGTYKALEAFSDNFVQARRGSGNGDMIWKYMDDDDEFDQLVNTLWSIQYLQKAVEYNDVFKVRLFDLSQGVIDIACKIWMLCQQRLIVYGEIAPPQFEPNQENIKAHAISPYQDFVLSVMTSVAEDSLVMCQPVLHALRALRKDPSNEAAKNTLRDMGDVLIDQSYVETQFNWALSMVNTSENLSVVKSALKREQEQRTSQLMKTLRDSGLDEKDVLKAVTRTLEDHPNEKRIDVLKIAVVEESERILSRIRSPVKTPKRTKSIVRNDAEIYQTAISNKGSVYDSLKQLDMIFSFKL
jgi:AAA domain